MKRLVVWITLAALVCATAAVAAPARYEFDSAHTQVGFKIRHFFSKVPGQFRTFSGTLMLDEKSFPASSVEFTIEAKSIDTGNERRDGHLRTADFFDVEKFPTLVFKSTRVSAPKNGRFHVTGDLTLRGVTKRVTLDCEFLGSGDTVIEGKSMGYRAGFDATTTINRKDFGILWNKTLDQGGTMLGDDVNITLQIEAVRQDPSKQTSAK